MTKRLATIGAALLIGLSAVVVTLAPGSAQAADYNNSNLMGDQVFDNVGTMNQSQIQNFLVAQGSTCLANYSSTDFNWNGSSWVYGPGNISASQVIYKAAQQWGLNPQVIIATLQKEESLITGASCDSWRYNSAMGYGCPDGGDCDSKYAGFSKQVLWGAWQLKFNEQRSYGNTGWDGDGSISYGGLMTQGNRARYAGGPVNFYNGYATIDGQSTYLSNGPTASLYTYTPHLNQAFPGIFEGWFGPVTVSGVTSPENLSWHFEQLDGTSGSVSGQTANEGSGTASIVVSNDIHLFYYDATDHTLRHAIYDNSTGWSFATLDGAGGASGRIVADVGTRPSVAVYNGVIHVFYHDNTNGTLRHAWSSNGTTWQFETLDGAGGASGQVSTNTGLMSTAIVNTTITPQLLEVFYYNQGSGNLRHAWYNGTSWHFENLDGDTSSVSHFSADLGLDPAAIVNNGLLELFYYDQQNGNLRHAWESPTVGWKFEDLDGSPTSVSHTNITLGQSPTVTAYQGTLQVFYYDGQNGNLRHAWELPSVGWKFESLDGDPWTVAGWNTQTGITPQATVLNNILYVFYYDASFQNLRKAWSDNVGWHFDDLDGSTWSVSQTVSGVGLYPTVVPYLGSLQLFYYDQSNAALRHAYAAQ